MKKLIAILLLMAFLMPVSGVQAQSVSVSSAPGTWSVSINIQNPSTSPANVTITFYDSAGNVAFTFDVTPAIPAGGARSLYVPTDIPGLGSGQFSAIASSDQQILTVINMSSAAPYTGDSYVGIPSGGTTQYFPGLYNSYYGFKSELTIQNAGSASAAISIQFYNQVTGAAIGSPYTDNIPTSASRTYPLDTLTPALPSGPNGRFSAVVTSAQPLVGIVGIWTGAFHSEFSMYNGFSGGANTIYVPSLSNNYYNFFSALTVQNIGTAATDITVTFSNGHTETASAVGRGASAQWVLQFMSGIPSGNSTGIMSAKVTSSGQPIVALVNTEDKVKGSLASYPSASNPTTKVLCPVVMKAYYKWFTAETVQNVGTAATNITITYPGGFTKTVNSVAANGTVNFVELAPGSVLPDGSVLAATITSSGQPLVAVTQENSYDRFTANPGDYLFSYTCTNQ